MADLNAKAAKCRGEFWVGAEERAARFGVVSCETARELRVRRRLGEASHQVASFPGALVGFQDKACPAPANRDALCRRPGDSETGWCSHKLWQECLKSKRASRGGPGAEAESSIETPEVVLARGGWQ